MNIPSLLSLQWRGMRRDEQMASLALLIGVVVTTLHRQACGVDALPATGLLASDTARVWAYYGATVLLFGLLPALVIRVLWKDALADYGVCIGDWKFGLRAIAVLLPVISLLFLLPAASMEDMRATYPVDRAAGDSLSRFLVHSAGRLLLFYAAWEFLFRGFLLFGLRRISGDAVAICVQTIPSALWHINYPAGELYMSIAGGLLFGWLALRTRSVLWPLLLHAGIGVVTDASIILSL
ncbi:MAG: CPBP family intramembrane metalloprotease [Bacteroidia bacterium]|nr:CPBP family intramembrane metalloprotease [Bacteroidia bacterium]